MNHFGFSLLPICLSAGLTIMLMLMIPSSTDGMEITVKSSKIIPKASNFLTKLIMRASSASKNEGTTISVDLLSEQTVADLKQAIKKETGIPPEQQLIRHNSPSGDVLTDGETLENGGLEKADVFLSFGELEIRVKNTSETFASRVDKTDTVATLKEAIKERLGILTERQILRKSKRQKAINENFAIEQTLRLNNTFDLALEDTKTMEECGIKDGQKIFLSIEFKINVRHGMKSYPVNVHDSDTVATLKEAIKERFGIPTEKQILRRSNRRKYDNILEDRETMDSYQQILDGEESVYLFITFTLNVKTDEPWIVMKIKDKIKDNAFTVEVEGTDSVETLKRKIGKSIGRYFSLDLQTLRQTDGLALKDHQTMDFYKIKEGQTILLTFHEFEIVIKYGMKRFSVNVKQPDTVETLKKKIENIKEFGNIPHENQALIRERDVVLENDSEPLHKYRVGKDTTVIVSWKEFEILVDFKEEQEPVKVQFDLSIQGLKEKIKEKFGITPERQKLAHLYKKDDLFNRTEFRFGDYQTMYFYDIVKGDTIFVSEVFEISVYYRFDIPYIVISPCNKVEVNAGDTVKIVKEKIKAKIEDEWGGRFNGQLVEIELRKKDKYGEVLDNDKETIEEAGIKEEGDEIYVKCAFPPELA